MDVAFTTRPPLAESQTESHQKMKKSNVSFDEVVEPPVELEPVDWAKVRLRSATRAENFISRALGWK